MMRLEPLEGVAVQVCEGLGAVGRDFLDVDAALFGEHEQSLLLTPVERDREVVLALDVGRLLDPELADDVPVDVQPEDRLRVLRGLVGRLGELDPAGLSAAAGEDLRLDDDLAADLLGGGASLFGSCRDTPFGYGDPEALEQFLSLMLVEVHRRGDSSLGTVLAASSAPAVQFRRTRSRRPHVLTSAPQAVP